MKKKSGKIKTLKYAVSQKIEKTSNLWLSFYYLIKKPLKSFVFVFVIGLQIAILLTYIYFIYRDKIGAAEGIRDTLTYQGKITNADGIPPPDGLYNIRFRIYDQASSGTLLWTEVWDSTNQGIAGSKVQVTEGVFTVELNSLCGNWVGSCSANGGVTFATDSFYLQVELDYDVNGTFEEIFTPRKRFTATPYSMNADKLDNRDSTEFLLKAGDTMTGTLNVTKLVDSSLLASYDFNGSADDNTPNGLNGTLQNSADITNDILTLDGVSQYVSVADNDLLSLGAGTADNSMTISAWVKVNDATNFIIASKGVYNTDGEYKFSLDSNDKITLSLYDESVADCFIGRTYNTALTSYEGEWINLVATYNGTAVSSGIKIYINGLQVDDTNYENNAGSYMAMENLTGTFNIGRYDANYAKGSLDDVKINNRALSADEVRRLYESENRAQLQANKVTTHTLYLAYVDNNATESGYLTWDAIYNRIKISTEVYAPNSMPYLANQANLQDYTHYTDANKVLAYDFSDSVGTTVTDLAGNANGTVNGDADWTNLGYLGYGMKFDASGDSVSFTDPGLSSTQGSIEFWVKFNNLTTSTDEYIIKMSEGGDNEIVVYLEADDDSAYFKVGNSGAILLGPLPDTNWHHFVLTWNNGDIELYGDGNSALTDTYTTLTVANFTSFYLGSAGTTSTSLDGSLDGVAIYDDVLTAAEVKNHYNSAFENLYVANNLSDGIVAAPVGSLVGLAASNNENNKSDPVYFSNDTKVVGLAFPEGQGTTTVNVTAADNPTISGTTWTKGYYGYGLDFNGSSDYLTIADSANINMGTDNFSLEFYIKADASDQTNKRIISKRSGDAGYEIYFDANNKITFFLGDGSNTYTANVGGGVALNDGKWHNVMFSFDRSGNALIAYDSSLIYSQNITSVTGSLDNAADLYIGKNSAGNYYNGILDSTLLYKGLVLSLADIVARATNGPDKLIINSQGGVNGLASLLVLNNYSSGQGSIIGLLSSNNTSDYPLKIWNQSSSVPVSDTIYNLIYFGTTNTEFGNLIWDDTNSQFIFSQSLKTEGDLATDYIQTIGTDTSDNEFLAFDIVRHTINATEAGNGIFAQPWSKATMAKIASLHAVYYPVAATNVYADQDFGTANTENFINYDGTNINVTQAGVAWSENDVVTIFIVYEK